MKSECSCSICSNSIREERQYAAVMLDDGQFVILDAEELAHFNSWMDDKSVQEIPNYPQFKPLEDSKPVLAYGVLIPQYDSNFSDWDSIMEKYKDYAFGTLSEEKVYLSSYSDYQMFPEESVYSNHIPCALLLQTTLELTEEREYGFGYTSFLIYSNFNIFDNILNRKFLFCLGGIEEAFDKTRPTNWKKCINKDSLKEIVKRLF